MDDFLAEEWEIWHSYSTYFKTHIEGLEKIAKLLIDLEIADCSIMSDGKTFCRTGDGVAVGKTELKLSGDAKKATIDFQSNDSGTASFTPYARETWLIGSQFLYGEARQFSSGKELPPVHLRAFLKPIELIKEDERISGLYPIVILYQSGVIIIEFRMFSPDNSIELTDFIDNYVNIHQCDYDYAMVPTALGTLAPEAYQIYSNPKSNFLWRIRFLGNKKRYEEVFKKVSDKVDFGDFEFEMVPLLNTEDKETITSVAQTLFGVMGFLISRPVSNFDFLLRGVRDLPELGNYWIGRPNIHLIRHSNQLDDASSNGDLHKESFGRILARVPGNFGEFADVVPIDSRRFSDFSAYITSAVTLWVWSKKGLESQQEWMDVNRGNLVYERQVQVELLEYGYILHKSLVEKSSELKNYPDVLATRRDLIKLKSIMLEATPYGEVRDLLSKGWEEMNLAAVQSQISDNLSILESEIKFFESKQGDNFRLFLTIFGLIASAAFAKSVVSPLWKALHFWLPLNENWAELFLVCISAILVISFVLALRRFVYR
ncbi:hypothetical protein [Leptolyngbya sp. AN10]|uniref:hypothetical protein n=1 Tax=Leptolyngbya sp. AN10 TaxID=3423365 RepID=UPI003D316EB9